MQLAIPQSPPPAPHGLQCRPSRNAWIRQREQPICDVVTMSMLSSCQSCIDTDAGPVHTDLPKALQSTSAPKHAALHDRTRTDPAAMVLICITDCVPCTLDTMQGQPGWQIAGGLQGSRHGAHGAQVWEHSACKVSGAAAASLALHPACSRACLMTSQYEADIARWVTAPPAVRDATVAMWVDWLTARLTSFLLDWRCTLKCASI